MLDINLKTPYETLSQESFISKVKNCTSCALHKTRTNVVFGHGPIPCNAMIIGEGPGEQEDLSGKPFVGKSGNLLTKILDSVGINREKDLFIANTVKCRPPGNRTPFQEEITSCKGYLIRQIQLVQPKILILLGAPALKTILEEKLSISKVRGNWYKISVNYMTDPLYIMPIFHPSYLLRNASREVNSPKWHTWQDFKQVKAALDFYS
tara:strand:- start:126 stop:749 length:624 start_codon:yes stop_codon:yes gene_type:complete